MASKCLPSSYPVVVVLQNSSAIISPYSNSCTSKPLSGNFLPSSHLQAYVCDFCGKSYKMFSDR
ncbi:uncharacterized protein [Bemisia tabaci]|uniref:uncharacterized protein n=1 Tax=Bemisia tabaci TaxID=7038 RepID=UPI003B2809BB